LRFNWYIGERDKAKNMELNKVHFVASVDDEHLDQIDQIVKRMEDQGFLIEKVRKLTGTISGLVNNLNAIREVRIKGVSIEPERTYYTQTKNIY
jgi:hypothetical protein